MAAVAAAVSNGTTAVSGMSITTTATAGGGTIGQFYSAVTPTVAGTYVYTLKNALGGQVNTWTIKAYATDAARDAAKVADNASLNTVVASTSTSYLNLGETTTATADVAVSAAKLASATAQAATVVVTSKTAGSIDKTSVTALTATISGPGSLGIGTAANVASLVPTGRAITGTAGQNAIAIFADGTPGVATVTISAGTTVLGIETVTFYGDIAKVVTTVAKPVIGVRTDASAVTAKAYDAAGTLVSSGNLYLVSGDSTVFASSGAVAISATTGVATFDLTGLKAGSTTVTVANAATDATVKAAAATVRVGSIVPAAVSVTTDKSTYAPGEVAKISVALTDASGLALADGDYTSIFATGGIVASYSVTGDTTTATAVLGSTSGVKTYSVYLPVTEGDVKFSWTTGTGLATANQGVAGSVTVNVSSPASAAAIDAANEASQAASDATDAALAAADAADAATTKAQEAVDAVATLSAQVSKLITALKAQITTLTNLVIKIQKKVKA